MNEQEQNKKVDLPYDWNKLELAQVAQSYLKQGKQGLPYAQKSLELILKDANCYDPATSPVLASPEVIQKTIQNQLSIYNEHKKDQKVSDLIKYHSKTLENYFGEEDIKKVETELEPFMDKKYSDIEKEIEKANYIIKGKKEYEMGSDEDVKEAEKVIEKYEKVIQTISLLEMKKESELKYRVENETYKESLQSIYKQPVGEEK